MPQSQPTVCAIMLVNGRAEMVRRAVKCFREQTYVPRFMLLFDTGTFNDQSIFSDARMLSPVNDKWGCLIAHAGIAGGRSVGQLRNAANLHACEEFTPDILVHFDSDDWSHPNRIAEQVALLQSSGKQCVGYRDMLFWEAGGCEEYLDGGGEFDIYVPDRAWLYSNNDPHYCLGTSLCYWREAWERRPFPDLPKKKGGPAEDVEWLREVDSLGVNVCPSTEFSPSPRMIASIHGANTQYYNPAEYVARQMGTSWKRAAEWDQFCRERMSL